MVISVASGKGGTGKTTFAVNLAYALASRGEPVHLLDCDVEEPNAHLFINPAYDHEDAVTVRKPVWDAQRCTGCGTCAEKCHFHAMAVVNGNVLIFDELCHACGVCTAVCPEEAISEVDTPIGTVQTGFREMPGSNRLFFAHGLLNIGQAIAPEIGKAVRQHASPRAFNIVDASPGTACPVVKALEGSDVAVLVTEPTPFGLSDLELAVDVASSMRIPTGIVVNRSDGTDLLIEEYADRVGIPIIGRTPFRREYAEQYSAGELLVVHDSALNPAACTGCGRCADHCHFQAIRAVRTSDGAETDHYRIDPLACEGCGLCLIVCPEHAVHSHPSTTGSWFVSLTEQGTMVRARLNAAQENSGRLVTQVRSRAAELAHEFQQGRILADGPPGIGCPVIATVSGADLVIVVTEPTVSGVHDMERVLDLCAHFGVRAVVLINKADLNRSQADRIEAIAHTRGVEIVGRIPFSEAVTEALVAGKTVVENGESEAATAIRESWTHVMRTMQER